MILYGYWRSSCSWRVRIALHHKGVQYRTVAVDLLRGAQLADAHRQRNPLRQVPVLDVGNGRLLTQSMAILAWLEAVCPQPALMPTQPLRRAEAMQIAEMVNAGIQPLQNLAVLRRVEHEYGANAREWARHFICDGLDAVDSLVATLPGQFCTGDVPTLADVALIPQLYNARRFECDTTRWPALLAVEARAMALPAFRSTHPDTQTRAARAA